MNRLFKLAAQSVFAIVVVVFVAAQPVSAQSILTVRDAATNTTRTFTPANARFTLSGDRQSVIFTAGVASRSLMGSFWDIKLEAPEGEVLQPGTYSNAGCPGMFRTGRAAGLHATENNPLCRVGEPDQLWGSFVIRQIAFDAGGRVTSIEANFTQHVGSPTAAALAGSLRFDASPLSLVVKSDSGFTWGAIHQRSFGDTSFFSLQGTTSGLVYDASVLKDQWRIRLDPPTGTQFHVGVYVTRASADASAAGMAISRGLGPQACNGTGILRVLGVESDQGGIVRKLRATFEYRCNGAVPALRGEIRHNL